MINKSKCVEPQPKNVDKGLEVMRKKSMMLRVRQHFWPALTAVVNSHRKVNVQYFLISSLNKGSLVTICLMPSPTFAGTVALLNNAWIVHP